MKPSVIQEKPRREYKLQEQAVGAGSTWAWSPRSPAASQPPPLGNGVSNRQLAGTLGGFKEAEFVKGLAEGLSQETGILLCVELPRLGQAHDYNPFALCRM